MYKIFWCIYINKQLFMQMHEQYSYADTRCLTYPDDFWTGIMGWPMDETMYSVPVIHVCILKIITEKELHLTNNN